MAKKPNEIYEEEQLEQQISRTEGDEEQPAAQEVSLSQKELEVLARENVCPGCQIFQDAENMRLRALADSENVKKRLHREADEIRKYAGESVLADLLPVLDNLDLALAHTGNLDGACKNFVMGVDMTRKIFLDTLKRHGLESVCADTGCVFDPELQEAVGTTDDPEKEHNAVTQVVQSGYILKGRLLRPAKVLVNKLK